MWRETYYNLMPLVYDVEDIGQLDFVFLSKTSFSHNILDYMQPIMINVYFLN